MARLESKMIIGYLPIEVHHHAAIVSLATPGTPAHKLLAPYANELDGAREAKCLEHLLAFCGRGGEKQVSSKSPIDQ